MIAVFLTQSRGLPPDSILSSREQKITFKTPVTFIKHHLSWTQKEVSNMTQPLRGSLNIVYTVLNVHVIKCSVYTIYILKFIFNFTNILYYKRHEKCHEKTNIE